MRFTTDFPTLLTVLTNLVASGDEEEAIEAYELIARFHPKEQLPPPLLSFCARAAFKRNQFYLSAKALGKLVPEPEQLASNSPEDVLEGAARLGYVLSRHLLNPLRARQYLEKVAAFWPPGAKLAASEIERILAVLHFTCPESNPPTEVQAVYMSSRIEPTHEQVKSLPLLSSYSSFDYANNIRSRSGAVAKQMPDAATASRLVTSLRNAGVPAFHMAESLQRPMIPIVRQALRLNLMQDGFATGDLGIAAEMIRWDDVLALDVGILEDTIQEVREPSSSFLTQRVRSVGLSASPFAVMADAEPIKGAAQMSDKAHLALFSGHPPQVVMLDVEAACVLGLPQCDPELPRPMCERLGEALLLHCADSLAGAGIHLMANEGLLGTNWRPQRFRSKSQFIESVTWLALLRSLGLGGSGSPQAANEPQSLSAVVSPASALVPAVAVAESVEISDDPETEEAIAAQDRNILDNASIPVDRFAVARNGDYAYKRAWMYSAHSAYCLLAPSPEAIATTSETTVLSAAWRIGLMRSQNFLDPWSARAYLEAVAAKGGDLSGEANKELARIRRVLAYESSPPKEQDAPLCIVASTSLAPTERVTSGLRIACRRLNVSPTDPVAAQTGFLARGIRKTEDAVAALKILRDADIPAFLLSESAANSFISQPRSVSSVRFGDDCVVFTKRGESLVLRPDKVNAMDLAILRRKITTAKKSPLPQSEPRVKNSPLALPPDRKFRPSPLNTVMDVTVSPCLVIAYGTPQEALMADLDTLEVIGRPPGNSRKLSQEWFVSRLLSLFAGSPVGKGAYRYAATGKDGDWSGMTYEGVFEIAQRVGWLAILRSLNLA
ncbi:MAG: hypothetical protein WC712_05575 [Candidatus Brocadiia bacterium]